MGKQCDVWDCTNRATYINPSSTMRYCLQHAQQLNFRIVYDSGRGHYETLVKLKEVMH